MSTRDPLSRLPAAPAGDGQREPTQSMSVEPGDLPDLALGTHQVTSIESPAARSKTQPPARPKSRGGSSPDEYVGAVLGSYRVVELLGKGGMGAVYRAEHVKLGREVALKLLRGDYSSRRDAVARFFHEARTVNRVRHRNIVDVTDFVELDDGTTYIIMELLTGVSLGTWARGGVDVARALAVLVQICDGLAAAHQVGVVHRDLKPDNVIVVAASDGAEHVKLLDFGVAKLLNRDDEDVGFQTAAGSVIGTPAYMSPEQAGGMAIDGRSDIYSLGAIMYELFCGQPMFRGRSFGEYVRKHLTEMPIVPRQTPGGAQIDPQIEAVILRCLEKDPEHRYASILELREALLGLLGGMDTRPQPASHPPLATSGVRLPPAQSSPRLPGVSQISSMSQIPSLPPIPSVASTMPGYAPTPISQVSHVSGQRSISAPYPVIPDPPTPTPGPVPAPRTRWRIAITVGVAATGIGVAAAFWLAGRDEPVARPAAPPVAVAAPRPAPVVAAVVAPVGPAAAVKPPLVEIRFDSQPSGAVFGSDHAGELCRTPCTFDIDPGDGGPTDRREFVVKRDGYGDGAISVDLASDQREYRVTLVRTPDKRPARPARPRAAKPPPAPPPVAGKPSPTTIDPAATLDPFHPRK